MTYRMYIDGAWTDASGGAAFDVINPATEAVIAKAPDASRADVERAIAAARRAFDDGPWPRSTREDRARVLRQLADALEKRKERIRELLVSMAAAEYVTHHIQLEKPTFIFCTPSVQHLITPFSGKVAGWPRSTELSNTVPSRSVPW